MVRRDLSLSDELFRKILHILSGVAALAIGLFVEYAYGLDMLLRVVFVGILLSLVLDHLRIERGMKTYLFSFLQRAREVGRLHATTYALIGILLAFVFFDRNIAYASCAMFFFGDAAAAIVGRVWGKKKLIGKKSSAGATGMFIVSLAVGWPIVGSFFVAVAMALVATLVEAASDKIDDSFLIILFSGLVGQVLTLLL